MTAKGSLAANHAARGAGIIQQLFDLVGCEADEPEQVTLLNGAIDAVNAWRSSPPFAGSGAVASSSSR